MSTTSRTRGSQIHVTVVVAAYNSGIAVMDLIRSLDRQSMPGRDFELIVVDDGSTDDTLERLRAAAVDRPNMHVESIPNSGWPGRPRNVGLARARGDYVFFADHDDEFFPQALQRMHAMATADEADVVYGKVVRVGARTPYWELAHADLHGADIVDDRLLVSRSTHKLYRREYLSQHGIRFLEGRVRLEDHHFMGQVLAHEPVVSVLASYPCYRWIHRNDGTNSSASAVDLESYFDYFVQSVELLQRPEVEPRVREAIAAVSADRMFMAIRPKSWFAKDPAERRRVMGIIKGFLERCVPESADHSLGPLKRQAISALRASDLDQLDRVQRARSSSVHQLALEELRWDRGRLVLRVSATLCDKSGEQVRITERDGMPELLPGGLTAAMEAQTGMPAPPRLTWDDLGRLEITVRHRETGIEWPVRFTSELRRPAADGGPLTAVCEAEVDPADGVFGQALEPGLWSVTSRSLFLGEWRVSAIRVPKAAHLPLERVPVADHEALVHRGSQGHLVLRVAEPGKPVLAEDSGPLTWLSRASWSGRELKVEVGIADEAGAATALVVRHRTTKEIVAEARLSQGEARVVLPPGLLDVLLDLYVRTESKSGAEKEHRVAFAQVQLGPQRQLELYSTSFGNASIRARRKRRPHAWLARRLRAMTAH
ncbi:MAG: glycosyltransferase family 2 protein [Ornithinibacter sp.]